MLELTSIEISNLTWAKKAIGHRHLDLHHDLRWVWCHQGPVRLSLTMALILAGVLARGWCSCREAESFLLKLNIIQCYWNFMDKIVKRKQTVTVLILVPMQLKVEWTILTFSNFSQRVLRDGLDARFFFSQKPQVPSLFIFRHVLVPKLPGILSPFAGALVNPDPKRQSGSLIPSGVCRFTIDSCTDSSP